jgi:hypothetical protein
MLTQWWQNPSKQISGVRWHGDISIAEMMAFFGILIKMVLSIRTVVRITWSNQNGTHTPEYDITSIPANSTVFHANDNTKMAGSNDSCSKFVLFWIVWNWTFPSILVDAGPDEASVSSRLQIWRFFNFLQPN